MLMTDLNNKYITSRNQEERNGITTTYTSTFEYPWKIQISASKMESTTEFLAMSCVKSTINLSNYNTIKFWTLKNIEYSPKDSFLKMVGKSIAQMEILSNPLCSLWNSVKNNYKVGIIPTLEKISLQGKLLDSLWFSKDSVLLDTSILLLRWRFWLHSLTPSDKMCKNEYKHEIFCHKHLCLSRNLLNIKIFPSSWFHYCGPLMVLLVGAPLPIYRPISIYALMFSPLVDCLEKVYIVDEKQSHQGTSHGSLVAESSIPVVVKGSNLVSASLFGAFFLGG